MSSITDTLKTKILYNKNLGVATNNPDLDFASLPSASAYAKIFSGIQILSNKIPAEAPGDLVKDASFSQIIDPQNAAVTCERHYSEKYPWIVRYTNYQLTTSQYRLSYHGDFTGNHPLKGVNLISQTIPFNYDPKGSYGILVYLYSNSSFSKVNNDDTNMPWNYDKDAGYITFYGGTTNNNTYLGKNPIMTFWRYEGTVGFDSFNTDIVNGTTGSFNYLTGNNIRGTTGTFDFLGANSFTGSNGNFDSL